MITPEASGELEGMTPEEVTDWQTRLIELRHPTTALALFYAVVALEDYLRDFGSRLASAQGLISQFPSICELQPRANPRRAAKGGRPDEDPASLLDPQQVNTLYLRVLGVEPFKQAACAKLSDLALLRHTIAHHGSVIRRIDTPRFSHFRVSPGEMVCPPVEFVRQTAKWIFNVGSSFNERLSAIVFPPVLSQLAPIDRDRPPEALRELIEVFSYFGKVGSDEELPPELPPSTGGMTELWRWQHARSQQYREVLLFRCVDDLLADSGSS